MKKITTKHYLNTNLKPVEKNGKLLYPVYLQLIYNRFSTNKRSKTEILTTQNSFELYLKTNKLIENETIYFNVLFDRNDLKAELKNSVFSLQIADKQNIKIERKYIFKFIEILSMPVNQILTEAVRSEYSGTLSNDLIWSETDYERFINCYLKIFDSVDFIENYTGLNLNQFLKESDRVKFLTIELISLLFSNYSFAQFVNSDYERIIREHMKEKTISEFDIYMNEIKRLIASVIKFADTDSKI
jgi:hypothetical protein